MPASPQSASTPVMPRPSSAVVLVRERAAGGIEVLMVRRQVKSDFAPDVYVFPGGSVQPGDREAELTPGLCGAAGGGPTALGSGLRVAAIRELFEEAGVLLAVHGGEPLAAGSDTGALLARLARARDAMASGNLTLAEYAARDGLRLDTDSLLHWAHWITPELFPKRFSTHFFLAPAPRDQLAAHDNQEVTESVWVVPEDALAGFERGEFPLVFATIHQLRSLCGLADFAATHARFAGREPETIMPLAFPADDGGFLVKLPNDPGPPIHL